MRKLLICLIIFLLAISIKVPDVNVVGINITGLVIGVASKVVSVAKFVLKQVLTAIANML